MGVFNDLLGTFVPIYGAATGAGLTGKLLNPSKAKELELEDAQEAEKDRLKKAAKTQGQSQNSVNSVASVPTMKRGGRVKSKPKAYASGGAVKKTRGDGCAQRGKTRGTMR
jgi:hypothetical protein